jgi:hypothetical protein
VFRSLTLLAVSHCEREKIPFTAEVFFLPLDPFLPYVRAHSSHISPLNSSFLFFFEALTASLLKELMGCLHFGEYDGKFDIKIEGEGHSLLVSQVANTILKEPRVGKNIPTVAKLTQGEVITFAAAAAETMRAAGMNVLMEGRAQTLDYVRTPHRFELTLAQPLVIGQRRAAQRMIGAFKLAAPFPSHDECKTALKAELEELAK